MRSTASLLAPILVLIATSLQLAAQALPDAPSPRADNIAFVAFAAADAAAMLADARITADATHIRGFYEMDPLFGREPSPRRVYVQMALTTAGVQFLSWELRRHGVKWWAAPQLIDTCLHWAGATITKAGEPR